MSSKQIKLEHFQNLVAIAFADGYFDDEEKKFLFEKAEEFNLPFEKVEEAIENADTLKFVVPLNLQDREDQLADIVFMAMIDGDIHKKEYELCLSIANRLDLNQKDLDDAISLTKRLWKAAK